MKPYSKDLRVKVLAAVDRGMPRKDVARIFGVSEPTIRRYLRLRRQTGNLEPRAVPGPSARKREALEERLPTQVRLNPDLTLSEHCELFAEESGIEVSTATMSRSLKRLGLPLKKSPSRLPSETSKRGLAGEKRRAR
jgi:transposase